MNKAVILLLTLRGCETWCLRLTEQTKERSYIPSLCIQFDSVGKSCGTSQRLRRYC
jgi:hypothetical protein